MSAVHFKLMASQLGMQPRFVAREGQEMAERMPDAIEQAARAIAPDLTPSSRTLAERFERFVASTSKKLAARLKG